jgi:hypothetical protein
MTRWKLIAAAVLAFVEPQATFAFRFLPPEPSIVASPDGSALLRIDPGDWPAKQGSTTRAARATVFLYDAPSRSYRVAKSFTLRNPVAPSKAIISDGGGYIVTFDDWEQMGCTANVVVIYRGSGELVKAWALEDIFSPSEIKRFGPSSINASIRGWRGDSVAFIRDEKAREVWIPYDQDLPWRVNLRLDLWLLKFEKYPVYSSDR